MSFGRVLAHLAALSEDIRSVELAARDTIHIDHTKKIGLDLLDPPIQIHVLLHVNGIHPHLPLHRRTRRNPRAITRRMHLHLHHVLIQPSEPTTSSSSTNDAALRALRAPSQRTTALVLAVVGGAECPSEDALEDGLEDGEAAAGYADVDFDGGPDEGAGVGVGAVGEGDGGDGVGAEDADAADAGSSKYVKRSSGSNCSGRLKVLKGGKNVQSAHGEYGTQRHLPAHADL